MEVLTLGNPLLHRRAVEVNDFGSDSLKSDFLKLKTVLADLGGMGIAAPQLGINRRLLLIHSRANQRYPHAPNSSLIVMVNPKFRESIDQEEDWEGCLSVPGLRGLVSRASEVEVDYQDLTGQPHSLKLAGFMARIFLHENDHLDGLTFLDRIDDVSALLSEKEYFRQFC